jgi:hypothetical protein
MSLTNRVSKTPEVSKISKPCLSLTPYPLRDRGSETVFETGNFETETFETGQFLNLHGEP